MKFHVIGEWPAKQRIPVGDGVSLAVFQWMELVRGERAVRVPANRFQVEQVLAEEHYCLFCFGIRWFDVVCAIDAQGSAVRIWRCRCCGKEGGG
jgi:hypothetical protein